MLPSVHDFSDSGLAEHGTTVSEACENLPPVRRKNNGCHRRPASLLRVIACIETPEVIKRILVHLATAAASTLPAHRRPVRAPRSPAHH